MIFKVTRGFSNFCHSSSECACSFIQEGILGNGC
jgi:hypothetical protein